MRRGGCGNANLSPGDYVFYHSQNPAFLTSVQRDGRRVQPARPRQSWEESEDHTTWTFHLREDVTWSDGTPSTADDHIFTINMVTNPEFGATPRRFLQGCRGLSGIPGWHRRQPGGCQKDRRLYLRNRVRRRVAPRAQRFRGAPEDTISSCRTIV